MADRSNASVTARDLQRLWLSLTQESWASMAVVPTDPSDSARGVTGALIEIAGLYELSPIRIVDAGGVSLVEGARVAEHVESLVSTGARVVVAVDSPYHNPGAVPILNAVTAALLLVRLGSSDAATVHSAIAIVGRERILGCVAMEPDS